MKALVFSESPELIREMLSLLNGKADVDVAFAGMDAGQFASKRVYLVGDHLIDPGATALALEGILPGHDYMFVGATTVGREVAAIISQDTNLPMESEIMSFDLEGNQAKISRFYYGGKTVMEKLTSARIFTVMAGVAEPLAAGSNGQEIINVPVNGERVTLVSREEKQAGSVDITKADIIVAVGRGIGKKEGLDVARQLATALGGELAGSRPVCSDLHWLEEERQVGLSGKRVKPRVYIALGISGQIQHIVGMRDSKTVIAINRDKSAPIFNECDYGIVGDLYAVVPKLISAIKH